MGLNNLKNNCVTQKANKIFCNVLLSRETSNNPGLSTHLIWLWS